MKLKHEGFGEKKNRRLAKPSSQHLF